MNVSECPQCGAPAKPAIRLCEYCKAEFFVTSVAYLSSLNPSAVGKYLQHYKKITKESPDESEGHMGLGLTYLQMGMYPLALNSFARVLDMAPELPQAYYYSALAKVQGRRLMTLSLKDIKDLEQWVITAIQLDDSNPSYKLLLAILKRDYYEMNGLKVLPPSCKELMAGIEGKEVEKGEVDRIKSCVLIRDDFFSDRITLV